MYGIFAYIYLKNQPYLGKYTNLVDPMEYVQTIHRGRSGLKAVSMNFSRWGLVEPPF